jgi:glycosyltransferase involved in cell wall biosynthesis
MPDIIEQHDAQLVIAGDGPERPHLERLVEQRGLQDVVSFLGAVPHTELPQYISASDIVVIPSLMEASSLFLIESMACKRPVVATNVGGIPEILNDRCGVLVRPRDVFALSQGVNRLLADQNLRDDLATEAYAAVREALTWDNIARRTEKAYANALSRTGS